MLKETPENFAKQKEPIDDARPSIKTFTRKITVALGIFVAFAALAIVLWQGAEVFLLIFAGFLLAVFLRSLSEYLSEKTSLSGGWSLAVVLFGIFGLMALGSWLLSDSVQTELDQLSEELPAAFERARDTISQYPIGRRLVRQIPSPQEMMVGQTGNLFGRITGFFSTALNAVMNVLVILIVGIYFASSPQIYREGFINLVPQKGEKRAREILSTVEFTLRRFLLGIGGSMVINGTITAVGLWLLGIPFAIPLGIITGLLNFIPNIGPILGSAPAVLIAFSNSPTSALYVAALYLAVQNVDGFVTTPLIQQRAVSLPPVLVIGSQLLLAALFGFLGLLLAVPLVAAVFVLVKMIYVEDILGKRIEVKGEPEAKVEIRNEALKDG